jgi:hypothetical protein
LIINTLSVALASGIRYIQNNAQLSSITGSFTSLASIGSYFYL